MTVAQMVATAGWEYFRNCENDALRETAELLADGGVIATGGGMVLRAENRTFMRAAGRVFFLFAPAELLAARLAADPQSDLRPPLADEAATDSSARETLYREAAHHTLDAVCQPEKICRKISSIISNYNKLQP